MHPRMDFARISRIIARSTEIAAEPRMHLCVVETYKDCLATLADAFAKAHAAVSAAESAWRKDSHAMREALARLDAPFRAARSTLRLYEPDCALPPTLKSQRTDTDKLVVIEELCNAVKAHAGKTWADGLLQGEFGALAQQASTALWTAIATSKALEKARNERMRAYLAVHGPFVAFKQVVRNALGPSSPQYRRIHIRSRGGANDSTPEDIAPPSQKAA